MSEAFKKAVKDAKLRPQEPQDYERQYLSKENEKAFEDWTKRLVPKFEKKPF